MKKIATVGVIVLSIFLLSSCLGGEKQVNNIDVNNAMEDKMDSEAGMMEDKMDSEAGMMEDKMGEVMSEGVYSDFSEDKLANASGNIVLFFAASWCPSCKTADKNLNAETIPENLTILKLDFDSSLDLRKQYGVTTQHTFVQVDNTGKMIKKWIGSRDSEEILDNIK